MKTAVTIPDDLFKRVERLRARERMSRSTVYAAALREYVARHEPGEVTEAWNRVCDEVGGGRGEFAAVAASRILERVEW